MDLIKYFNNEAKDNERALDYVEKCASKDETYLALDKHLSYVLEGYPCDKEYVLSQLDILADKGLLTDEVLRDCQALAHVDYKRG